MKTIYIVAGENGWETDSYFTSRRDAETFLELLREEHQGWEFWIESYKPAKLARSKVAA